MSSLTKFRPILCVFIVISVSIGFVKGDNDCYPFCNCNYKAVCALKTINKQDHITFEPKWNRPDVIPTTWDTSNEQDHINNEQERLRVVKAVTCVLLFLFLHIILYFFQRCCSKKCQTESGTTRIENQANSSTDVMATAPSNLNDPLPSYEKATMGCFPSALPALADVRKDAQEAPPPYNKVMGLAVAKTSAQLHTTKFMGYFDYSSNWKNIPVNK